MLAAALVPLLGACHLLLPLRPGASSDGPPAETQPHRDGPFVEGQRHRDGPNVDAPWLDKKASDGCPAYDQGAPPACLPTYRNPSLTCKGLLWEETFAVDPASQWSYASGSWHWGCGALDQTTTSCGRVWALSKNAGAQLTTPSYLVEGRITFRQDGCISDNDPSWSVGIAGRASTTMLNGDPAKFIACFGWLDPHNSPPVTKPDALVLYRNGSGVPVPSWWPLNTYDASPGKSYYLQLYYSTRGNPLSPGAAGSWKALVCRLCDEQSCKVVGWADIKNNAWIEDYIPTEAGTVGLVTYGRAASFDYLRVYELTNP